MKLNSAMRYFVLSLIFIAFFSLCFRGYALGTLATGPEITGIPEVRIHDGTGTLERVSFLAYDASFLGGVRVALGDLDGDGTDDLVAGGGPGEEAFIKIFSGWSGALITNFLAYNAGFSNGVFVATGDVNGDGRDDIVTGADASTNTGPLVKVFNGTNLSTTLMSFFAFAPAFTGGVRVATAKVNGDNYADIIIGAGPGGGPQVTVFSGLNGSILWNFFAYGIGVNGGIYVSGGDVNGDGFGDLITGAGPGSGQPVNVFSGLDLSTVSTFFAYAPTFDGGVRVAAADLNGDSQADIITGPGKGLSPQIKIFSGLGGGLLTSFLSGSNTFTNGIFVAASSNLSFQAPIITIPPASQFINPGQSVNLNVTAIGSVPLIYQWYEGVSGETTNPVLGATNASYTTPLLSKITSYWVRVTNGLGTANSTAATITISSTNYLDRPEGDFTGDRIPDLIITKPKKVFGLVPLSVSGSNVFTTLGPGVDVPFPPELLQKNKLIKKTAVVAGKDLDGNGIADFITVSNKVLKIYFLTNSGPKTPVVINQFSYKLAVGEKIIGASPLIGNDSLADIAIRKGTRVKILQNQGGILNSAPITFSGKLSGKVLGIQSNRFLTVAGRKLNQFIITGFTNIGQRSAAGVVSRKQKPLLLLDLNTNGVLDVVTVRKKREIGFVPLNQLNNIPVSIVTNVPKTKVIGPK